MAKRMVELTRTVADKKTIEDLYGQLDRLKRELNRILSGLDERIKAFEQKSEV